MTFTNLYLGICAALVLSGVFHAVRLLRKKMPRGRARRMGITDKSFGHMIIIYYLVLSEAVYGLASFMLDFPLLIDVSLFLVVIVASLVVYSRLIHREKFNQEAFKTAFLFPIIIPGFHIFHILVKLVR